MVYGEGIYRAESKFMTQFFLLEANKKTDLVKAGLTARAKHIENCTRPLEAPKDAGFGELSFVNIMLILRNSNIS